MFVTFGHLPDKQLAMSYAIVPPRQDNRDQAITRGTSDMQVYLFRGALSDTQCRRKIARVASPAEATHDYSPSQSPVLAPKVPLTAQNTGLEYMSLSEPDLGYHSKI
jgi:hypothetical protein